MFACCFSIKYKKWKKWKLKSDDDKDRIETQTDDEWWFSL